MDGQTTDAYAQPDDGMNCPPDGTQPGLRRHLFDDHGHVTAPDTTFDDLRTRHVDMHMIAGKTAGHTHDRPTVTHDAAPFPGPTPADPEKFRGMDREDWGLTPSGHIDRARQLLDTNALPAGAEALPYYTFAVQVAAHRHLLWADLKRAVYTDAMATPPPTAPDPIERRPPKHAIAGALRALRDAEFPAPGDRDGRPGWTHEELAARDARDAVTRWAREAWNIDLDANDDQPPNNTPGPSDRTIRGAYTEALNDVRAHATRSKAPWRREAVEQATAAVAARYDITLDTPEETFGDAVTRLAAAYVPITGEPRRATYDDPYPMPGCDKRVGHGNHCLLAEGHDGDCDDDPDIGPMLVRQALVDVARRIDTTMSTYGRARLDAKDAVEHVASIWQVRL